MGGCDALSTTLQPFLSQFNLMRKSTFFGHYENWFQSLPLFLGGGTNFCVSNGKSSVNPDEVLNTMTQDLKMELEKHCISQSVNKRITSCATKEPMYKPTRSLQPFLKQSLSPCCNKQHILV